MNPTDDRLCCRPNEAHPVAYRADALLQSLGREWLEERLVPILAEPARAGNRRASIMGETLRRYLSGEPVSDRYLLGLAFFILTEAIANMETKS
ncbi:MAG: hypothetical protein U1F68_14970 [Gammaproteobacteria bacterium]